MSSPHELRIGEVKLAWEDQGAGRPVIFVHGLITDRRVWRLQRDDVALHHRFVAIDLRHHGESSRGDSAGPYSLAQHKLSTQLISRPFSHRLVQRLHALLATPMAPTSSLPCSSKNRAGRRAPSLSKRHLTRYWRTTQWRALRWPLETTGSEAPLLP